MSYAENTSVPVERSRAEIEATLIKYGATSFASGWDATRAVIQFACDGRQVRFVLAMPDPNEERFTKYKHPNWYSSRPRSAADARKAWDQECRRRWRALVLVVRAKLEAVATGVTTFESEFLAHIVMPGGKTVGELALPEVTRVYETGDAPKLLLLGGAS